VVAAALRIHFFLRLFPRCATVVPRQHELLPSFCFSLACISGMCAPYTRASKTVFAFFAVCLSVPCREVLLVGRVVLRVLIPFFFSRLRCRDSGCLLCLPLCLCVVLYRPLRRCFSTVDCRLYLFRSFFFVISLAGESLSFPFPLRRLHRVK
jgi:hypothetical protein